MDPFSLTRLKRLIESYKHAHGRDIAEAEILAAGFTSDDVSYVVKKGLVDKYQITNAKGSRENRFKIHRDWHSLKET
jgi:hypothetical protein